MVNRTGIDCKLAWTCWPDKQQNLLRMLVWQSRQKLLDDILQSMERIKYKKTRQDTHELWSNILLAVISNIKNKHVKIINVIM